jgi:hypothetical protein
MKILTLILVVIMIAGCSCEKSVSRFHKKTFKKEQKLLIKGCISEKRDSIPVKETVQKLPDTIRTNVFVEGPTIRDTFRIECDELGRVIYRGKVLSGGVLATAVKCPDLDSVISIYNKDKVTEETRANYCCDGWQNCEKLRVDSLQSDVCGFWCKFKMFGIGAVLGIALSVVIAILLKLRGFVSVI